MKVHRHEELISLIEEDPTGYSTFTEIELDEKPVEEVPKSSKDQGWGWVVAIASLLAHMLKDGIIYSYGIFAVEFIKHYGISRSTVGMMGSLLGAAKLSAGPLASFLCNKFSYRVVSITGTIIASFGFAAPYFYDKLWFLILMSSVVSGVGFGLVYLPAVVIVNKWFDKKRPIALGIAVCGSGLGTFVFSFILEQLIIRFGWQLTMLITGEILTSLILVSFLYRNFPKYECELKPDNPNTHDIDIEENVLVETDQENCYKAKDKLTFSKIMCNPLFLLYLTSSILVFISLHCPYMFVKDRALQLGVSSSKSSFLLSLIGIGNFFGRLGFGMIGSVKYVNRFHLFNLTVTMSGLILILSCLMKTYALMTIYTLAYGILTGAFVTLTSVVLVDIFGIENLDKVFGTSIAFQAIASFAGPPLIGYIYDTTLSYDLAFSICGISIAAGGLIMYLAFISKEFRKKKFST